MGQVTASRATVSQYAADRHNLKGRMVGRAGATIDVPVGISGVGLPDGASVEGTLAAQRRDEA